MTARLRRTFRSARSRILVSYLILLGLSMAVSFVAIRQLLLVRLDDRIQDSLVREAEEFRQLSRGRDPATGRRFGTDVRTLFDVYLSRNVPDEGEALLTFIDGRPYRADRSGRATAPVERDATALARWVGLTETAQGELSTPAGPVRYIAVPVLVGGETRGVLAVTNFTRGERQEVDEAIEIAGGVALGVLLVASALAFFAAGRVLAPLQTMNDTARVIEGSDLTRRIDVEGDDEIADLTRTFNAMLDRLDIAFSTQRAFVNDASHELRTPLTIVRGHLELMGDDPEERRETLDLVMDEIDRMDRFVDDLVLLAKAERPDFLRLEALELEDLSHELFAKAHGLATREWHVAAGASGTVRADRQRLTQAVMNLAHNAVQHTGEGDRIGLGSSFEEGFVRLWVSDEGPGIDPDDQRRVFERFARGDGVRRSAGAGLGLSIVRAIAEAHGGGVELASHPGWGSTFTLVIPVEPHTDGGVV